jgi:hypothetical protein
MPKMRCVYGEFSRSVCFSFPLGVCLSGVFVVVSKRDASGAPCGPILALLETPTNTRAPCGPIVYDWKLTFWAWLCSYYADRRGRGRHRAGTPVQLVFSEIAQKRAR